MACYHPQTVWRVKSGRDRATGKWAVTFKRQEGYEDMELKIPCGQCIGCRLERSRQWAIRCVHEASLHDQNCFLTLTYDDQHLPPDGSLNLRDIQLFLKRFRKNIGSVRFFQCGEYGEQFQRPHHHMILFGYYPPDATLWSVRGEQKNYMSQILNDLWGKGHVMVGSVTFESAAYVARYITKKVNGQQQDLWYGGRKPEYVTMSRKPGIAADWFAKYQSDVYPSDNIIMRGKKMLPPRYYDNQLAKINPAAAADIKINRKIKSKKNTDNNTPERLAVRETTQKLKNKKLKRGYENA